MSVRLGEILLKESLITQDQLDKALEFQRSNGGKLGSCLTKMGFITDDDITGVLSRQYGVPSINLKYYEIDPNVIKLIPQDTALRYQVVPLSRVGSVLTIAMTDPTRPGSPAPLDEGAATPQSVPSGLAERLGTLSSRGPVKVETAPAGVMRSN